MGSRGSRGTRRLVHPVSIWNSISFCSFMNYDREPFLKVFVFTQAEMSSKQNFQSIKSHQSLPKFAKHLSNSQSA